MPVRWTAPLALMLLVALAACGSSSDPNADGTHLDVEGVATTAIVPPDPTDPTPPIPDPSDAPTIDFSGSLDCNETGPTGTGVFAAVAPQVCEEVVRREALFGQIADADSQVCSEIYGGPQHATVSGSINGQSVDVSVERTNGCGIQAWQDLEWLLGPPER